MIITCCAGLIVGSKAHSLQRTRYNLILQANLLKKAGPSPPNICTVATTQKSKAKGPPDDALLIVDHDGLPTPMLPEHYCNASDCITDIHGNHQE
jgi:hypothetical protein